MNILFVEDDPMNRRVVKDMLSVVGAKMDEAENAETGLSMVDSGHYDVVLMDLRMPGMDGMSAMKEIRARADHKASIPIIVVTADMAVGLKDRCIASGADDVILKPVAMDKLLNSIGTMLAKPRADKDMILD